MARAQESITRGDYAECDFSQPKLRQYRSAAKGEHHREQPEEINTIALNSGRLLLYWY
jgi:hypothetical protein